MLNTGAEIDPKYGIDGFNRITVFLLNDLYNVFPNEAIVKTANYFEEVNDYAQECMDGTMIFLEREGFIVTSGGKPNGHLYLRVQLTKQGLGVLNKTLDALESSPTVISKIKAAVGIGSTEAAKEVIKYIVTDTLKGNG